MSHLAWNLAHNSRYLILALLLHCYWSLCVLGVCSSSLSSSQTQEISLVQERMSFEQWCTCNVLTYRPSPSPAPTSYQEVLPEQGLELQALAPDSFPSDCSSRQNEASVPPTIPLRISIYLIASSFLFLISDSLPGA